jgi:hypothetical protein
LPPACATSVPKFAATRSALGGSGRVFDCRLRAASRLYVVLNEIVCQCIVAVARVAWSLFASP